MKIGDICYTNKKNRWCENCIGADIWHDVPKNESFYIIGFSNNSSYIDLKNIREGYKILMTIAEFNNDFNIKILRKQKIEKLKLYEENDKAM